MNNTFKTILAAGALVIGAQQASAVTVGFRDIDSIGTLVQSTDVNPTQGNFDIVTGDSDVLVIGMPYYVVPSAFADINGFNSATDTLTTAVATFYFRDEADVATESFSVNLDGFNHGSGTVFNGGVTIFGESATVNILAALQTDGQLIYSVTAGSGSFYFDYALLDVVGDRTAVPDGGATAMLLGLGFIGAAAIRRKVS